MDNTTTLAPPAITEFDDHHSHSKAYLPLWYVVLVLFLAVFGMVGNSMTLMVLFRTKLWTSVNVLIGIMSFSDLLVLPLIASLPLQVFVVRDVPVALIYLEDVLITSSCVCAAIIGCERSYAIRSPLQFKQKWNTKLTVILFIVTYTICLCFVLVRPVVAELVGVDFFDRYFYFVHYLVTRGVPFLVILITNILMIQGLIRNSRRMKETTTVNAEIQRMKKEASISRTVVAITTVYFICLVPGRLLVGLWHVGAYLDNEHLTYFFQVLFELINFSVNIVIYTLTSTFFREEYIKLVSNCHCLSVIETVTSESNRPIEISSM